MTPSAIPPFFVIIQYPNSSKKFQGFWLQSLYLQFLCSSIAASIDLWGCARCSHFWTLLCKCLNFYSASFSSCNLELYVCAPRHFDLVFFNWFLSSLSFCSLCEVNLCFREILIFVFVFALRAFLIISFISVRESADSEDKRRDIVFDHQRRQ